MNKLLELAEENLKQQLPFVLYKKPKEKKFKGVFQKDDHLNSVKSFKEKGFVFAPFDTSNPIILIEPDLVLEIPIDFKALESKSSIGDEVTDTTEKERYTDLVSKAVEKIRSNAFKKVVLSRKAEVPFSKSPILLFKNLINSYDNAFCYLWYHPKVGMWLGATPEILVKRKGMGFITMSLAGTQAFNSEQSKPVWSDKELDEQQLVTDYIHDSIMPKTRNLEISAIENVRAGALWHLRTKISGQLSDNNFGELVAKLHPTPAVCGLPLEYSKKFILENEKYDRSFYTGYLGELNFKEERTRNTNRRNTENSAYKTVSTTSELYVNLRCLQLVNNKAVIYVGGGITKESDPLKEWQETVYKSCTMLNIL